MDHRFCSIDTGVDERVRPPHSKPRDHGAEDVPPVPKRCVVTGGMGFVGRRLVEMLVERGAERVVAFDVAPKPDDAGDDPRIVWFRGDLTKPEDVDRAIEGAECVWHIAALVGPYHKRELYDAVNHVGTLNVIAAARSTAEKCVMSSSPSTRFDGKDINGKRESELSFPKVSCRNTRRVRRRVSRR